MSGRYEYQNASLIAWPLPHILPEAPRTPHFRRLQSLQLPALIRQHKLCVLQMCSSDRAIPARRDPHPRGLSSPPRCPEGGAGRRREHRWPLSSAASGPADYAWAAGAAQEGHSSAAVSASESHLSAEAEPRAARPVPTLLIPHSLGHISSVLHGLLRCGGPPSDKGAGEDYNQADG